MNEQVPAVNHHGDHPGFGGLTGLLCGLAFLLVGRANAKLATAVVDLSAADHVVDVGCGPGTAARQAARRGARVTGIDPAPVLLWLARLVTRGRANITWRAGTAESVPLPDSAATVLWALATVHHWQDVAKALAEAHRVLAPGGRLLAIERQVAEGATGFASHGWTLRQAEAFATLCRSAGLGDVNVAGHRSGRRPVWTVLAVRTSD